MNVEKLAVGAFGRPNACQLAEQITFICWLIACFGRPNYGAFVRMSSRNILSIFTFVRMAKHVSDPSSECLYSTFSLFGWRNVCSNASDHFGVTLDGPTVVWTDVRSPFLSCNVQLYFLKFCTLFDVILILFSIVKVLLNTLEN